MSQCQLPNPPELRLLWLCSAHPSHWCTLPEMPVSSEVNSPVPGPPSTFRVLARASHELVSFSTDDLQSVRKLLHEVQSCKVQILCTCWCILARSCCKTICNRYSAPPRRVPTLWIPMPGHVQRHQEDAPGKCGCFLNAECGDGDLRWKKHLY